MLKNLLNRIGIKSEKAQTLIEYALILVLLVIIVIVIITAFKCPLQKVWCDILNAVNGDATLPTTCTAACS